MRVYEYEHVVGFAETNLVGNVYFAHHLFWQGRCRERFLSDHAPGVLRDLRDDLRLVTLRCNCEYFEELTAADELTVAMSLVEVEQNRITLAFDYLRGHRTSRDADGGSEQRLASGSQTIATMRSSSQGMVPCPIPGELMRALAPYRSVGSTR